MSRTASLERATKNVTGAKGEVEFETHIMVLAMLAGWAQTAGTELIAPFREWAVWHQLRTGIPIGNDIWIGTKTPSHEVPAAMEIYGHGIMGIMLTRIINEKNGGRQAVSRWFPMVALMQVRATLEGVVVSPL